MQPEISPCGFCTELLVFCPPQIHSSLKDCWMIGFNECGKTRLQLPMKSLCKEIAPFILTLFNMQQNLGIFLQ
jgi:hypothetical protein